MEPTITHTKAQRLARPRPVSLKAPAEQTVSLGLSHEHSAGRHVIESCVAQKFEHQFSAQLSHFLPYLLSLRDSDQLGAIVGMQPAGQGTLFLEQYLDSCVEQAVAEKFQTPVDRSQIVEIGNLAAVQPGAVYIIFAVLASVLHEAGFKWVVCTATPQVESLLSNMQFPYEHICNADPARLEDNASDWGEYYSTRPRVIAGNVEEAARRLAAEPGMAELIGQLADSISDIAASLKSTQ